MFSSKSRALFTIFSTIVFLLYSSASWSLETESMTVWDIDLIASEPDPNALLAKGDFYAALFTHADLLNDLTNVESACPESDLISLATVLNLQPNNNCPKERSKVNRRYFYRAVTMLFRSLSADHEDFYQNAIANYDGPVLNKRKIQYGMQKYDFIFAHNLGLLLSWDSSLASDDATFGKEKITYEEASFAIATLFINNIIAEEPPEENPDDTPDSTDSIWQPQPGITWHWQLQGEINTDLPMQAYDIDLFDTDVSVIDELHAQGKKVICYFSAGSWENWRDDAGDFPDLIKGRSNGWSGEKWLDIRAIETLEPIMAARLDLAVQKGCDAVEPDNIDGYSNRTNFDLSYEDQILYNRLLADLAHERGLAIALKNDLGQVQDLVNDFDFAINESCFTYNECDLLLPFIESDKAVLGVEYEMSTSDFCAEANAMHMSFMKKDWDLFENYEACWDL